MQARVAGWCMTILLLSFAPATCAAEDATHGVLGPSDGEQVYAQICQGCHMPGGRGAVGAGYYPAFVENSNLATPNYMAATSLNGRRNMPSFVHRDVDESFVTKMQVFLVGDPVQSVQMDCAVFMKYYTKFFGAKEQPKLPVRSAMQVAALAHPGVLVEIEVTAIRP